MKIQDVNKHLGVELKRCEVLRHGGIAHVARYEPFEVMAFTEEDGGDVTGVHASHITEAVSVVLNMYFDGKQEERLHVSYRGGVDDFYHHWMATLREIRTRITNGV